MAETYQAVQFQADVYRNIVSLKMSQDLFDDLADDVEQSQYAIAAEMRVKKIIPEGSLNRAFYYSAAIEYPFIRDHWNASRFSDGSFPVWYGSLECETTLHETCYHALEFEQASGNTKAVRRERAIYVVSCEAILIKATRVQPITACRALGQQLRSQGQPGLLYPSARCQSGINLAAFNISILNNSRLEHYLRYEIEPAKQKVRVYQGNKLQLEYQL